MSADLAFNLRSTSIDEGVLWRARRWGRFAARYAIGAARSTFAADPHSPGRQTR
jgi:hypothetical protein